ncbi:hypothetical protein [Sideroxydans sp. CL21]|uniref:hypothetical protein n=1 Tax=Sideroxydans sp. CL21 TaxID=2600596 RepID=UPI0024BCBE08|nr:hypothetical protein [Sideroxydans sp. CL21]
MAIRLGWQKTPAKSLVNGATKHTTKVGEEASTALTIPHLACRIADCVPLVQRSNQGAQ